MRILLTLLAGSAAFAASAQPIDPNTGELAAPSDPARCALAPAGPSDQVLLHGLYEAAALSTVRVGASDSPTRLARVHIQPGSGPLYLVLAASEPTIWSLHGAVDRVSQVAAVTTAGGRAQPAAGVVGAPAARVRVLAAEGCFRPFHDSGSADAQAARATVEARLGRAPAVTGAYSASTITLPGGETTQASASQPPSGFDAALYREGLRFYPAGIASVDPAAVVGARAQRYAVLPAQMGLAQLTGSGSLRRQRDGGFRIVRPIAAYPEGLAGAQAVRFTLARGVAPPRGSPAHACVRSEADGRVLHNPLLCAAWPPAPQ